MSTAYAPAVEARFWEHVSRQGDCWVFTGRLRNNQHVPLFSYGERSGPGRRRVVAQRIAWELTGREIDRQQVLVAECNNALCVRPSHHRLGTRGDRIPEATHRAEFWAKVGPTDANGCRPWTGGFANGYGMTWYRNKAIGAHRLAWLFSRDEPIPDGIFVCHHCDNPPCCNPDHLFLAPPAGNSADMKAKGRARTGKRQRKLSPDQVRELRRRYAAGGVSIHALAREFGVSSMVAWHIEQRHSYKDIT